jgi:hypothetical protein
MRGAIHIFLLFFTIVCLARPCWGLTGREYEEKFSAQGKRLMVAWGLFGSIEERERLEGQLEVLWEAFRKHRDDFRLTKRIEIERATDLFSLSDEIQKDNDLVKITLSRAGKSVVSEDRILKTLRSRPFFHITKEVIKYRKRKVVRDLGREGYYYEEDGEIKYAAVDTVELFQKKKAREKILEEEEEKEKEQELLGE